MDEDKIPTEAAVMKAVTNFGKDCFSMLDFMRHRELPSYLEVKDLVERLARAAEEEEVDGNV